METWFKKHYAERVFAGELVGKNPGTEVFLCGWAFRFRDQGGVIFIDLRDRSGMIQIVARKEIIGDKFSLAEAVRSEYVLAIRGKLQNRDAEAINPKIPTVTLEVIIDDMEILNTSKTPPFQLDEFDESGEDIRLKYRYLEFRKEDLKNRIFTRHNFLHSIRNYLHGEGFWKLKLPS